MKKLNVALSNVSRLTKVRHKSAINRTLSGLRLSGRRVLLMAIAQLDSRKIMSEGQVFRIYASEYAKIAKIEINTAYEQLAAASIELQSQLIAIPKEQLLPPIRRRPDWKQPSGKGTRVMNITEYCDYEVGEGYVDIVFSAQMEPYICNLGKQYTTQFLLSTARLSETNAYNLYQLIRQKITDEQKSHYFDIDIEDLKDELGLFSIEKKEKIFSYPLFKDFNKVVLKRSIAIILEVTEFKNIDVEIIKKEKRKAKTLRFSYSIDSDHSFEGINNDDKKTTD